MSTSASALSTSRLENESSAVWIISSARVPMSSSASVRVASGGVSWTSFVSLATVTQ